MTACYYIDIAFDFNSNDNAIKALNAVSEIYNNDNHPFWSDKKREALVDSDGVDVCADSTTLSYPAWSLRYFSSKLPSKDELRSFTQYTGVREIEVWYIGEGDTKARGGLMWKDKAPHTVTHMYAKGKGMPDRSADMYEIECFFQNNKKVKKFRI